jgi:hypothetical protein
MVELSLDGLSELSASMNDLQYWFTIVIYILMGIVVFIVLYSLYKILSCGVCLMKCITCPCRCLFKKKKTKEEKINLLQYRREPKVTSLV